MRSDYHGSYYGVMNPFCEYHHGMAAGGYIGSDLAGQAAEIGHQSGD